jgi:hypothetical protein
MAGNDRNRGVGQVAVDDVQVGPAHAARGDADANLCCLRLQVGQLHGDHQPLPRSVSVIASIGSVLLIVGARVYPARGKDSAA